MKYLNPTLIITLFFCLISTFISCNTSLSGRYKNAEIIYDIKPDGTYDYIELEVALEGMSENEVMLKDYDKLPRKETLKGSGKWRKEGNQIILDGTALQNEYLIKNGRLCSFDVIKNGEVCFEKE